MTRERVALFLKQDTARGPNLDNECPERSRKLDAFVSNSEGDVLIVDVIPACRKCISSYSSLESRMLSLLKK